MLCTLTRHVITGLVLLLLVLANQSTFAETPTSKDKPKGVILIVIDDIGYGDIDALYPSDLETPNLDALYRESVSLTDFHVGTTCAPSRASFLTGRNINAGGVWHTIVGRELLREDEKTAADVFGANGWKTGIFGKWHLGEGYPFSPRFRGFDVSVIHGGGGVGQGPDFWKNDYYSGVDRKGKKTQPDTYWENGELIEADKFCTDFWFDRSMQFMTDCIDNEQPFFCYIPTNAAHGPFNAPYQAKEGFDGLIENIDENMQRLDQYLKEKGLQDDVLLIFTCDNGTAGSRLGGLRAKKGSHYDGGHNVPCFVRWKNGGIGGSESSRRDVNFLTAGMDLLPTFMDVCQLEPPTDSKPLHGISLKEMLQNSDFIPQPRTITVDTQRTAGLDKWMRTCVMRDEVKKDTLTNKWRLIRQNANAPFELYDFTTDRDTNDNLAADHPALIESMSADYEKWWAVIEPATREYLPFVVNPEYEPELTLYAHSWIGKGGSPWHQNNVRNGKEGTRTHSIRFDKPGLYRFELRRWPREDGGAIDGTCQQGPGQALPIVSAKLAIGELESDTQTVTSGEASVVFEMDVQQTERTDLVTSFMDAEGKVIAGAYYVYIRPADNP